MQWDYVSTVGSQVVYQCISGYQNVGGGNISVCNASGEWDAASLICQGDDDIFPHSRAPGYLPQVEVIMQCSQMLAYNNLNALIERYEANCQSYNIYPATNNLQ